jgi:hypothetical protein
VNGKRPGGWVALAWRYYRDERLLEVSADAELLWGHALAFTGEQATDGRVPEAALPLLSSKLVGSAEDAAAELVAAGLWVERSVGWSFGAAWERWQPTAEQSRTDRERAAKRKALSRQFGDSMGDRVGESRGVGEGEGEGEVRSTNSPYPSTRRREEDQDLEDPARLGWEEYTDAAGNLFVRHATNGQAAELEP